MKKIKINIATKDDRGDISDIFYKHPVDHVAIINSKKGAFRGDHYHKFTIQHMYMTKGSLRYYYRSVDDTKTKSVVVKKGEMVSTPPNEVHALEILEDRFARGELSDIEYQNKIRLLKLAKDHLKDKEEDKVGVQVIKRQEGTSQYESGNSN